MRFWHAVATVSERRHLAMAVVSAMGIRAVAPAARIGVVVDRQTRSFAEAVGCDLHAAYDEVLELPVDEPSPLLRSRSLKLQLREVVDGDFVYLDSDTLLVDPQDWRWPEGDVAMALDSPQGRTGGVPSRLAGQFAQLGWSYPVHRYFNAGVILWRDSAGARELARRWREAWRHAVSRGIHYDQPALAHVNRECGDLITTLPMAYNAPVFYVPETARTAHIWHFWPYRSRELNGEGSILHHLVAHYLARGEFDATALGRSLTARYPWGRLYGPRFLFRHGYNALAMRALVRRVTGGARPGRRPW